MFTALLFFLCHYRFLSGLLHLFHMLEIFNHCITFVVSTPARLEIQVIMNWTMMIRTWRLAVIALLEMIWWILMMMVLFQFMKVLALVRQNLVQTGTCTIRIHMKRFFHPLGIRIPRRKANQGSHGKCQASESPETENPPGVKLQLLLHHQAGDPVEAEVTTGKVIEMKAADLLGLQLGQTGKTWMMCSLLISLGLQDEGTLYPASLLRLVLLLQDGGTLDPACLIPLLHKGETLCLVQGPAIPDHNGAPTRILPANLRVSFLTYFQVPINLLHFLLYFFQRRFFNWTISNG